MVLFGWLAALGLLAFGAEGISVYSNNEGVFVNGKKVANGCCHNVKTVNGDVYVDGRMVGHFEDSYGRKKRSTNYNVNNNGGGSTNNNNNNNGAGNNYNINNNDGGYNVNNNNNEGAGTNVNVNNNGGGYNVNNNYNGNSNGNYNINNNNNGGGGYSLNNNWPNGGMSVSGPGNGMNGYQGPDPRGQIPSQTPTDPLLGGSGMVGNGGSYTGPDPRGQIPSQTPTDPLRGGSGMVGNSPNGYTGPDPRGQIPSQTPTDPLHGKPPNDPYNGLWPNDPYNGMNNDPYNGLWPNDPYNLNKGGPNQGYKNPTQIPFQKPRYEPFSPALGHKPFSREPSREPFSGLRERGGNGQGNSAGVGQPGARLQRKKREIPQNGNSGHLSGLSGNQGNIGNTNSHFGNNGVNNGVNNGMETGNGHWCDPARLNGGCIINNGEVCACGVRRQLTAEDNQMLQDYKQAIRQWNLDSFPPGFPFKRPTVQPKFPDFPPICKCQH